MNSLRYHKGLLLPPLISLMVSIGIVYYQSAWNLKITRDLREARREMGRLARLLPNGQTLPADHDDDHAGHGE